MTQLENEMLNELGVAQGFTNDLAENLITQGVAASDTEGLDTLVPKVLTISGGGSIEHDDTLNRNNDPDFLHATQAQHDRWTNNYSHKLTDVAVSSWSESTKYADFGYQAQILINNLTEADFVNVVFGVNEAVSGNYAPAIEQYKIYILVFSKVDTAITIPTIEITKIDL